MVVDGISWSKIMWSIRKSMGRHGVSLRENVAQFAEMGQEELIVVVRRIAMWTFQDQRENDCHSPNEVSQTTAGLFSDISTDK